MTRKEIVLITGANGEVGHGLIHYLGERGDVSIVALDVHPLADDLKPYCREVIIGDILDTTLLNRLVFEYDIRTIYHLASILSTKAEFNPEAAHRVNVEGTLNLLRLAVEQSAWQNRPVKFMYPSSIAVYGMADLETKGAAGAVKESEHCTPKTMYGCNKLYCEHLGSYYQWNYRQLAKDKAQTSIDFRSVRYPGLISAFTVPTGGTSDYGPEMLHAAARGEHYNCFVRPDACLPFMAMPDAIKALVELEAAPAGALTQDVYNVTSFNLSAEEIYRLVKANFPQASVSFEPDLDRQHIVDSWPENIDDNAARQDWGWQPDYDVERAFEEYLIPNIAKRYS